jgi:hypothetical protein
MRKMGLKMRRNLELMRLWMNMKTIPMIPEAITTALRLIKRIRSDEVDDLDTGCECP